MKSPPASNQYERTLSALSPKRENLAGERLAKQPDLIAQEKSLLRPQSARGGGRGSSQLASTITYRNDGARPVKLTISKPGNVEADRTTVEVPARGTATATFKTTAPARDVAVAGSHAFVVVGAPSETPREFKDQEVLILQHGFKGN